MINYRGAWNYRLRGTPCQRCQGKVQHARCSQNKSEKAVPFAWQLFGCTNFTWLLIWEILGFSNLYPATLQGKLPTGHGQLFSSFPHLSRFTRATCPKFQLRSPEKGRAALSSSSLALVLWHNLCTGTDLPAWLKPEAAHVHVSQAHTWILLLAKMWQKNPEPEVLQRTDRAVCGQLSEVSVDNFCQKLLLYKIQAEVTRKAALSQADRTGEETNCATEREQAGKKPCKVWTSRFVTPPASHWHCQGHNFNRGQVGFPQVEGLSHSAAWAGVTCALGMRSFRFLPQMQTLLCHRIPIKITASLSCPSLQG